MATEESLTTYNAKSFTGQLPQLGEAPIQVLGLDKEGLLFVEEEVVYFLARAVRETPKCLGPDLPITEALRAAHLTREGAVAPAESSDPRRFDLLSNATLREGSAEIKPVKAGLHVVWAADLFLTGYDKVAETRLSGTYAAKLQDKGKVKVEREVEVDGDGDEDDVEITTLPIFADVIRRSGRVRNPVRPANSHDPNRANY